MSVSGLSDLLKNKYESLFHRSLEKTQVSNRTFTSTNHQKPSQKRSVNQQIDFLSTFFPKMAPFASNFTSSLSYPEFDTAAFNATPAAATSSSSSQPSPDFTGTIIFGVIASVLAVMAIIIGYLQLRRASSAVMPLLPITLPAPLPTTMPTTRPTPAQEIPALPAQAQAPAAKDDV
jgi:hypothetical protein